MFGNKTKKLEKALENAAIELTMAEKLGPPPGGHGGAKAAVVRAAQAAKSSGKEAEVEHILGAAEDHPMYRGEETNAWHAFVAEVRQAV